MYYIIHHPFHNKVQYLKDLYVRHARSFDKLKKTVFFKEKNNETLWNFKLGCQESMNVPIWKIVGFQQKDRQSSQDSSNDTFVDCQLLVLNA